MNANNAEGIILDGGGGKGEGEVRVVIALWIVGRSDGEIWSPIASRRFEQPLGAKMRG
jgi:hypothetical protein